jgi:hypothetical protein
VQKKALHIGRIKLIWFSRISPQIANRPFKKAQYIKTTAYRLRPMQEDGTLAIDGERFPFKEYYAEVHRGLGTVLSMSGRYPVDFTLEKPVFA